MTDSSESPHVPEVPDAETWLAMTPEERMDVVRAFRAVLGGSRLQDGSPDPDAYYIPPPREIAPAPRVTPRAHAQEYCGIYAFSQGLSLPPWEFWDHLDPILRLKTRA